MRRIDTKLLAKKSNALMIFKKVIIYFELLESNHAINKDRLTDCMSDALTKNRENRLIILHYKSSKDVAENLVRKRWLATVSPVYLSEMTH